MRKWICNGCGLYIEVDLKKIKKGVSVYFYTLDHEGGEFEYVLMTGIFFRRQGNYFFILSDGCVFKIVEKHVYPFGAPVFFIYNMFGACSCS